MTLDSIVNATRCPWTMRAGKVLFGKLPNDTSTREMKCEKGGLKEKAAQRRSNYIGIAWMRS